MRKTALLSAVLAMSLTALPVEAAGKKQMSVKQVACLLVPGGFALAVISAANKKPAPCIFNMMQKRK